VGGILAGGSILAAFFGGAVALFSPCCIVFLLPAYLASAVKNRRWRLLPLTLLFALGLGVVLIPITLGIGLVASTLNRFHTGLYIAGGVLLAALAVLSFIGRSWSMPSSARAPDLASSDSAGVFSLGVFSGVASSCCAPVLAGVVTLSALASSPAGSFALGVAYVFGMTFPLFVMALAWDRFRLGDRRLFESRPLELTVFWVLGYAGGFFLPFRDATSHTTTFPGGRYLLDTIKGADLGQEGGRLILDFNYAYNPSCAYSPQWDCPLAPPENVLPVEIRAGEQRYPDAEG